MERKITGRSDLRRNRPSIAGDPLCIEYGCINTRLSAVRMLAPRLLAFANFLRATFSGYLTHPVHLVLHERLHSSRADTVYQGSRVECAHRNLGWTTSRVDATAQATAGSIRADFRGAVAFLQRGGAREACETCEGYGEPRFCLLASVSSISLLCLCVCCVLSKLRFDGWVPFLDVLFKRIENSVSVPRTKKRFGFSCVGCCLKLDALESPARLLTYFST